MYAWLTQKNNITSAQGTVLNKTIVGGKNRYKHSFDYYTDMKSVSSYILCSMIECTV